MSDITVYYIECLTSQFTIYLQQEKFENIKRVIRSRISKNYRQNNDQKKKDKQ